MKHVTRLQIGGLTLLLGLSQALAQGTAFTYQGRLSDAGSPATGLYDFRFSIYDALTNGNAVAGPNTNAATGVTNGLFIVALDFGAGVFTGPGRWLDIGVRTNGSSGSFTGLAPRQAITAAPYAIAAGDVTGANIARLNVPNTAMQATGYPTVTSGFITAATITSGGSGYVTVPPVTVNDATGSGAIITASISGGSVVSLMVVNAGSGYSSGAVLTIGVPPNNAKQTFAGTNFFISANTFSNAVNFSSPAGPPFMVASATRVDNLNADLLDGLDSTAFWKLSGNGFTTPGAQFLGTTDFQALELKVNNSRILRLEPNNNVIGGYGSNYVANGLSGATISGGGSASLWNVVGASYATISGGLGNTNLGDRATIAGGLRNRIFTNDYEATICGGSLNQIQDNCSWSVVAGGIQNTVMTGADRSFIGGGILNTIQNGAYLSTIGGGYQNTIMTNSPLSAILGGSGNFIQPNASSSAIGGGSGNQIQTNAYLSTISGGVGNQIRPYAFYATIGGGLSNKVSGVGAFIGGGGTDGTTYTGNNNGGNASVIAGGLGNSVEATANYSSVGGGALNSISSGSDRSTIAGGFENSIGSSAYGSTIGGGWQNNIISGSLQATVSGGYNNTVTGTFGVVPGGYGNAAGFSAFAAGYNALAGYSGSFVWSDATGTATASTANNQFVARASGGFVFYTDTGSGGASLAAGATSWSAISDRNAKKNISPVNCQDVLNRLARVPVEQWNYKWDDDRGTPNLGPMAQDFKAAFYPGRDDKSISTLEFDGVELAAIQGLNQKLEHELKLIDAENADLKARLERLEELLNAKLEGEAR
jgi:hypothetical protein